MLSRWGWRFAGKALAEHGSVLPFCSLPLAQPRGGLVRGWSFAGKAPAEHGSALPSAPSLWRSQGEGWGGVGLLLGRPLPSMARHYRLLPPFGAAKGRVGEGLAFRWEGPCRAWLGTTVCSLPLAQPRGGLRTGWSFAGKAPAEHGSALPSAPSLWRSQGEGWGGVGLSLGTPLPSMARHDGAAVLWPLSRLRERGWGEGAFAGKALPSSALPYPQLLRASWAAISIASLDSWNTRRPNSGRIASRWSNTSDWVRSYCAQAVGAKQ